jgi:DNA-binding CsgD family transcriptional regulator
MKQIKPDYSIYFEFIEKYLNDGFHHIKRSDPFIEEMEAMLKPARQFFFIGDLIQLKIIFTSGGSRELFGIEPEQVDPSTFYTRTHPDILLRHNVARTKLFNLGQELFISKEPYRILSSNLNFLDASGNYSEFLVQCYLFYSESIYRTVYLLQVVTDIEEMNPIKYGYHFYLGSDKSHFRYPDLKLLNEGNVFSKREYDILSLLAEGKNSRQIADALFLSIHTVNTHRRNMLKKSGKSTTHELILNMKERGLL